MRGANARDLQGLRAVAGMSQKGAFKASALAAEERDKCNFPAPGSRARALTPDVLVSKTQGEPSSLGRIVGSSAGTETVLLRL